MKKVLVLFLFAITLNSCGEGCGDCCLGDPCFEEGIPELGEIGIGDIEINEEELECSTASSNLNTEYSDKISEAENLANLKVESYSLEYPEDFWENLNLYINDLKVSYESEGGNLITLEEKLFLLDEEIGDKIDALAVSLDIFSQEWRDKSRLLDLELVEGQVELFSAGGSKTKALAIQFLEWFKETKPKYDETDDKIIIVWQMLELEIERLNNERNEAIEALNCN